MQGSFFRRARSWIDENSHVPSLPFSELLSEDSIRKKLCQLQISFSESVYTPMVTLWMFLFQVLSSDHSCKDAVARLVAFRAAKGLGSCSAKTGAYCHARKRLSEELISGLVVDTGRALSQKAHAGIAENKSVFGTRPVKVVDGTTMTMADTPANIDYFGKSTNQHGESGWPLVRMTAMFCLISGAIVGTAMAAYRGKKTGELTLFRMLDEALCVGDILLGDELYCNFYDFARLSKMGVDIITHGMTQSTESELIAKGTITNFRQQVVTWQRRPNHPAHIGREEYNKLPNTIQIRKITFQVSVAGFRPKTVTIWTTLTDKKEYSAQAIGQLYRMRWQVEVDFRSLKTHLQMDHLRCKSPELVRLEIWAHLLAYNLLREVMQQAAIMTDGSVRKLSFKGTMQLVNSFAQYIWTASEDTLPGLIERLLLAISQDKIGRPNRFEPRKQKYKRRAYPPLKNRNDDRLYLLQTNN